MEYIRRETKKRFSSVYLQLIGIIQALSLGYLFTTIYESKQYFWSLDIDSTIFWLKIAFVTHLIILIWHEYVIGLIYFKWVLGLQDSIIPFAFGLAQFGVITTLTLPNSKIGLWYFWVAFQFTVGIWGYLNMYSKARSEANRESDEENYNAKVFKRIGHYPTITVLSLVAMLFSVLLAVCTRLVTDSPILCLVVLNILIVLFTIRGSRVWRIITKSG